MRDTNMSIVRYKVVEGFATGGAGKRALGDSFLVRFQVTVEVRFLSELLLTSLAFVRFLASVGSLVGLEVVQTREGLATGATTMFLSRLFRWWLPRTRLNILQHYH